MNKKNNGNKGEMDGDLAISVLEQIPTPIMAVDREFKLIFMNEAGCELLGKSWDEICSLVSHPNHEELQRYLEWKKENSIL